MRACFVLVLVMTCGLAAWAKDPKPAAKAAKIVAPTGGVKTPGVLIPYASLKSEADLTLASAPTGAFFSDAVALADSTGIRRFDSKTNKPFEPSRDVKADKPCGGLASAFSALWTATCATPSLAKIDLPAPREGRRGGPRPDMAKPDMAKPEAAKAEAPKSEAAKADAAKPEAPAPPKPERPKPDFVKPKPAVFTPLEAAPTASAALAATADSLWLLADAKTSLQRIDPADNSIVAEIRLPAACAALLAAESSLWVACPGEPKLLRIDPKTNLVEKRIEVSAQPLALAAGDSSIWLYTRKEGKVARIDPRTNKVISSIDLGLPGADVSLAFGDGFLWASAPGFPVMRIAPGAADKPGSDKVVQQFHGEGGGWIAFGLGSVWVGDAKSATVRRFDPKRIQATLAE